MNRILNFAAVTLLSLSFLAVGCTPSTDTADTSQSNDTESHDHAHDDAPKLSLKEGLQEASKIAAKLNQGFEDGAGHDVIHDPLHDISRVLDALPKQITESELSDENKAALSTAVETLFDSYGKIDAKFHGGEGAEYADVKDKIAEGLASLNKILEGME